jgi:hypothetical protein
MHRPRAESAEPESPPTVEKRMLFEKRSTCEIGDVVRHFEVAVRASTLSVDLTEWR